MSYYVLPNVNSPIFDQQTGLINQDWYLFLLSIYKAAGSGDESSGYPSLEYLAATAARRSTVRPDEVLQARTPIISTARPDEVVPARREIVAKADDAILARLALSSERRIGDLEEYVSSLRRVRKPRLKTTSTVYPAFTLIQQWAGTFANIPAGFRLCDGVGGSIDLRNQFVIGAGTLAIGATGGSKTITAANLPAHTHPYTYNTTAATNNTLSYTAGAATKSVTVSTAETVVNTSTDPNTPSGADFLPPYYALAFITNTADYTVINSVELQD